LESWDKPISYYQGVGRSPSRVKDQHAKHIKEFQYTCFIHNRTTKKNSHINHRRKKNSEYVHFMTNKQASMALEISSYFSNLVSSFSVIFFHHIAYAIAP